MAGAMMIMGWSLVGSKSITTPTAVTKRKEKKDHKSLLFNMSSCFDYGFNTTSVFGTSCGAF